jgi:hypothetical protein
MSRTRVVFTLLVAAALAAILGATPASAKGGRVQTYRVTIVNLTDSQPLGLVAAATHRQGPDLFEVGELASPGVERMAEDGQFDILVQEFNASGKTTEAKGVEAAMTPSGTTFGPFTDTVTFEITARPGDRLSLATMIICTNDGFTGVSNVKLPNHGSATWSLVGYDAGTEDNTESSEDLEDPCTLLGPDVPGDPDGNDDVGPDTSPAEAIMPHPGIAGGSDLSVAAHGFDDPVARLTVERID